MINFFIETKSEYTIQLVNVLTPLIYEGVQSIYTEALKTSDDSNNVLKVFQTFLKLVPKWNPETIKQETDRIMNNSKSYSWLPDLVKATLKANIIVLTYNSSKNKVDPKYYKDVKIEDFIHRVYIECARELWNNPYLMYNQYPPIELKRNQRDTLNLVKEAIREGVRKSLPIKEILDVYLEEPLQANVDGNEYDKLLSEGEQNNIKKLIQKGLAEDNKPVDPKEPIKQNGGNQEKDLNSKILDIINKKSTDSDTSPNNNDTPITRATKNLTTSESEKKNYNSIDDKIKNILEKDLGDAEIDTSLSYHPETNEQNYQEIFTNNLAGKGQAGGGDSAKIKDSIGKQLAVPNKTTRKDKSRSEYLSSDYSLPPVVLDAPKEPVRIEDDNFSIGGL
jgi:hypothetical protein